VGRRGPLQVSFTIKEFRELTKVQNCKTIISSKDCEEINEKIIVSID
jgi:adrenodoxin-NADP+ reductase